MRSVKALWVVVCVLMLAATQSFLAAQTQTGTVSGVVVDPSEAVMPGATVTIKNANTGLVREGVTNEQGVFIFDKLLPGVYDLKVSKEGFRSSVVNNLDVRVGKGTDVGQIKMALGAVGETVQVEAETAPLMETQSAQITSSFTGKQTAALRQGFAGLDSLAILTPGVVPGFGNINSNGMQVAANGQRSRSTQFMLDGQQMNDITIGGPSFFIQNLDMISEYQVVTNQFSAEFGRNLGATVNIITKGGTNSHHGTAYWLHENSALRSLNHLETTKPVLINNNWGLTIGGPVLKNKFFYYFAYRGRKQPGNIASVGTAANSRVFTANGLNAMLAAFPTSVPLQVYRDSGPFAQTIGSPSCVAGTTTTVTVAGRSGIEVCAMQRNIPQNTEEKEYTGRMDWTGKKHTFFGRYMFQDTAFCCSGGRNGFFIDVPNRNQSVGFSHSYQFTPTMINHYRFSYGRFLVAFEGGNTQPIANVRANLTNITLPAPWLSFGLATNLPQNRLLNSFQWQDNWSMAWKRHVFKAGLEFQRNRTSLFFLPFINGQYQFTGADLTNYVNNAPATVNFAAGDGTFQPFEFDQFYYFQDDIRLASNLTVNLGVRYENNGQPINKATDEILAREMDPARAFWLQSVPIDQRTLPRLANDNNNWAPRIGFAYTPRFAKWLFGNDKTTIRGGYGVAYELAFYNILLNVTTAAPRVFSFALTGTGVIPMPSGGLGSSVAAQVPVPRNTRDPRSLFQTTMAPGFHNPYGQNWSLGTQREIGRTQVVEIRYVGSSGNALFQSRNANPLFTRQAAASTIGGVTLPGFPQTTSPPSLAPCATTTAFGFGRVDCTRAAVRERLNSGHSTYHSLQVRYDVRNWKNQFTGGFSYTYSRGMDNTSEIFNFTDSGSFAWAENPFNITSAERGVSNQNLSSTFAAHYIWEIPWFRSQQGWWRKIVGGWQVSGITTLLSGRPWTPFQFTGNRYCGEDSGFNSSFAGVQAVCRPFLINPAAPVNALGFADSTGQVHLGTASGNVVAINTVRFLNNDDNAVRFFTGWPFGVGRNNFRGDGTVNYDIAIDKRVKVTERFVVRYRMSMVNALNHRNFGVPPNRTDNADFGLAARNDASGRNIRMGFWVEF